MWMNPCFWSDAHFSFLVREQLAVLNASRA
jgi:hypothetical protein